MPFSVCVFIRRVFFHAVDSWLCPTARDPPALPSASTRDENVGRTDRDELEDYQEFPYRNQSKLSRIDFRARRETSSSAWLPKGLGLPFAFSCDHFTNHDSEDPSLRNIRNK